VSTEVDAANENRRLRAAMEGMRYRHGIARNGALAGGVIGAISVLYLPSMFSDPSVPRIVGGALAFGVAALSAIPFLRCPCPKCGGSYNSVLSVLRNQEETRPCRSCGFQVSKHVSRYS
jgi:hypothetical protein